ncbi:tRNA (adenosine(37)-N6)-threonylcarbamoyltransferase complex ATPase subunit type 1 TsaE [Porcipelethomonas sp.]|uniref:tRNA (adenosine(37)-N6)-threonylcarbamoyltransferase complex ATPase subunit type 1 TsaE n=1 Tax=Porcipelethomonas sp. TaxID=2981675 RepID=UPI003EF3E4A9
MEKITHSAEETIEFAKRIGSLLKKGDVIAYTGGLGAGKTTFTRGLAMGLGLEDNVTSPTFSLVNEYHGANISLYHFDMYRIMSADDLETTGFYDYPAQESIFAVEWSENIAEELPENSIFINIERIDDNTRKITVKGDERFDTAWN